MRTVTIAISGNSFENAVDGDNELLKTQTMANVEYIFTNNTYNGEAIEDVKDNEAQFIVEIEKLSEE